MNTNGMVPFGRNNRMNPFGDIDRFFEEALGGDLSRLRQNRQNRQPVAAWNPAVDIRESDNELVLTADIPGAKKEDLQVEVHQGVLTVTGERRGENNTEEERHVRTERYYGKFMRSFQLPDDVDSEKVNASYTDGVLEIRIPKTEAAKPRTVKIQ